MFSYFIIPILKRVMSPAAARNSFLIFMFALLSVSFFLLWRHGSEGRMQAKNLFPAEGCFCCLFSARQACFMILFTSASTAICMFQKHRSLRQTVLFRWRCAPCSHCSAVPILQCCASVHVPVVLNSAGFGCASCPALLDFLQCARGAYRVRQYRF